MINSVDVNENAPANVKKFVNRLTSDPVLTGKGSENIDEEPINTDFEITYEHRFNDNGTVYHRIKVKEYGNEGQRITEDEGTPRVQGSSRVVGIVQKIADDVFGHNGYKCTAYEDPGTSETSILVPCNE